MDQSNSQGRQIPRNVCIVCEKPKPSYKCPKCFEKYCSVNCCKEHKSSGTCEVPSEPSEPVETPKRDYYFPTKDTIPREKLELLAKGENLVEMKKFLEDPSIRADIVKLDTCSHPIQEFEEIMQKENFVKFAAFVSDTLHGDRPSSVPNLEL